MHEKRFVDRKDLPSCASQPVLPMCTSTVSRWKYCGQERILILLDEKRPMTQWKLMVFTRRWFITWSEQLEAFERAGYIVRQKSILDRQNIDVVLTEGGKQAAKKAALEQRRRRIARRKTTALFTFDAAIKKWNASEKRLKREGRNGQWG